MSDNNEVGYCRPPKYTRFQKGKSGNPKGRPRGSFSLRTAFEKALRTKIAVKENGRLRLRSKWEVAMIQLVNRALKGDPAVIRFVFTYLDGPSAADLRELAEFKEREERLKNMSKEELDAYEKEIQGMQESLERSRVKRERALRAKAEHEAISPREVETEKR